MRIKITPLTVVLLIGLFGVTIIFLLTPSGCRARPEPEPTSEIASTIPAPSPSPEPDFANEIKAGKVLCPVLKTPITPNDQTPTATLNGKVYALCCNPCLSKFNANPTLYLPK